MAHLTTITKRRSFDYSNLPPGAIVIVPLSEPIYVGDFRELQLEVRVHDKNMGTSTFTVAAVNELPSPEDPSPYFMQPVGSAVAVVIVNANGPAASGIPGSTVALGIAGSTSFGSHVRIVLQVTGSGAVLQADLSISLLTKGT